MPPYNEDEHEMDHGWWLLFASGAPDGGVHDTDDIAK